MILWSTSTAAAAQQLVALLTSESAVPTSDHGMLTLHTSDHECWRVELRSPAGKPLDVLALRALSDGGLAVRSGQVAWVYSAQQAETILTALRAAK